jgi:CDP-diacylglycerol--serine O-phosphatidyltransferase
MLDVMDGLAARMLDATSEIGKELDSMADLVSFGVAPAYLYYLLAPMDGWIAIVPAAIYVVAGALRLAIFNTKPSAIYFSGLPIPAAAFFMIGIFLGHHYENQEILTILANPIVYSAICIFLSVMMLSKVKMFSMKKINQGLKANKVQLLILIVFIALLFINKYLAIPLTVIIYILLSIIHSKFSDSYH